MRFYIEYSVVKGFIFLTKLLPNAFVYTLFKTIARLFFKYNKRKRTLTLQNLKMAYPSLSNEELISLASKSYESIGITLAETLLMYNDKLDIDSIVVNKAEMMEKFHTYLDNAENGVLFITGHFSNWELLAQFLAKNGYPIKNIARAGDNALIDKNIVQAFRGKYGNQNIPKRNAIISLVKTLKQGLRVGILFDQKSSDNNSIQGTFFGHPLKMINVIAQMKLKYNPLVIPIFIARLEDGSYKVIFHNPVEYLAEEEKDESQKILKMTQYYNDILEQVINDYPEQWFWVHNRWQLKL
jgi:KDO2-lipid IV(A) lauroyltransferase